MIRRLTRSTVVLAMLAQAMIVALLVATTMRSAHAGGDDVHTYVPAGAVQLLPVLRAQQHEDWPAAPRPWVLAGQVEQESCITLRHPKCWNPHAELKTAREYGFGLGQTTIAYTADGKVRFDNWALLRGQYRDALGGWSWDNRYDAQYQLRAFVLMSRDGFTRVRGAHSLDDQWAFALAGYNGGTGGVLKDRLLCQNTAGCDQSRWWGNVERTSTKSRLVPPGYGQSPFAINRAYPAMILATRSPKYQRFWE